MGTKYTKEFKTESIRLGVHEGVAAASEKLRIALRRCMHGSVPSDWSEAKRRRGFALEKVLSKGSDVWNEKYASCVMPTKYSKKQWVLWWADSTAKAA